MVECGDSSRTTAGKPVARRIIEFDGGPLKFQGNTVTLQGQLLFEFPHRWIDLPQEHESDLTEIRQDLIAWIVETCPDPDALHHCTKIMDETVKWVWFCAPKFYHDPRHRDHDLRQRVTFSKFSLVAWLFDLCDVFKSQAFYNNFSRCTVLMHKDVLLGRKYEDDTFGGDYKTSKIEEVITASSFGLVHPILPTYYRLLIQLVRELRGDPANVKNGWGLSDRQLRPFFEAYLYQYEHDTWLNQSGDAHLGNLNLRTTTRYYGTGGLAFVELCALLQGVQLTREERREKHLKRLKYLLIYQGGLLNDLFSVRKELLLGETDNLILLYCQQQNPGDDPGLRFENSVRRVIKEHDQMHEEAKEIYAFLKATYSPSSGLIKWLDGLVAITEGVIPFHMFSRRYGGSFQWRLRERS